MIRRKEQMRTEERPNLRGGDGVIHAFNLLEKEELCGKANLCAILTVDPGCSIGEHPHGPDAEIYYVLEGTLEAWDNGEKTILQPGDAMFTGQGNTHAVCNTSDQPARLLAVVIA